MLKPLIAAMALSLLALSPVSAAPVTAAKQLQQPAASELVQVQIRRNLNRNRGYNNNNRFNRRNRFRRAPAGYRRYSTRPYNYRARGCVIIGPVYFCP